MRSALVVAVLPLLFAATPSASRAQTPEPARPEPNAPPNETPRAAAPAPHAYHADIVNLARDNTLFRDVVFTGARQQIALMSIPVGEDIGPEMHEHVEQLFFAVSGRGRAVVAGVTTELWPGDVIVVPPGAPHDVVNDGDEPLQLFTVYTPPVHLAGRQQATKADAARDQADQAFGMSVR